MKEKKDRNLKNTPDSSNKKQQVSSSRTERGSGTEDTQKQSGAVNMPEKKPYSHRTGDATNFGDRSYQED